MCVYIHMCIYIYVCVCVCVYIYIYTYIYIYIKSCFSCIRLFRTLYTVEHQAPLSMEFYRQEYWSGLPFPTPRDLPDPRIKLTSLVYPGLAGRFFATLPPGKPNIYRYVS